MHAPTFLYFNLYLNIAYAAHYGPVHTETFSCVLRESRRTSSLLETIQKRRKTFPCVPWPISAASLIKTAGEMSINISFITFLHKQLNFNVIHLK